MIGPLSALVMLATLSGAEAQRVGATPHGQSSHLVLARGRPDVPGAPEMVLIADGDRAWIATEAEPRPDMLSVEGALEILGDRRLQFMWPALLAYGGNDLALLRERRLRATRKALEDANRVDVADNTGESTVRPVARALLQYANALVDAGRAEQAVTMLRQAIARPIRDEEFGDIEFVVLSSRLASVLRNNGQDAAVVLRQFDDASAALGASEMAVNLDVNRTAYLAEYGRYAEALAAVDRAEASFNSIHSSGNANSDPVPGSDRQFTWIRVCALHGLRRREEAAAAMLPLVLRSEPRDPQFTLSSNRELRMRLRACMRDADGLAEELIARLSSPDGWGVPLLLQSGFRSVIHDPAMVEALRAHPRLQNLMASRVRELGPELRPAMNRWRTIPSAD